MHSAAGLLSQVFGEDLKVEVTETFYRTTARCKVIGSRSSQAPASIIVKRSKAKKAGQAFDSEDPDPQGIAYRLFNDWAGMDFLAGARGGAERLSPVCWGGSRDLGFLLVEDCGDCSLDEALVRWNAGDAEAALVRTAKALGKIHVGSLGREVEYAELRRRLGPLTSSRERVTGTAEWMEDQLAGFKGNLASLGFDLNPACHEELAGIAERIGRPGALCAYTHGDLCPDNVRLEDGRPILIDFEHGGFRHAMTDAVFGRMLFPTCWKVQRLPRAVVRKMEDAYRTELAMGVPGMTEDAMFHRAILDACAYWLIVRLAVSLRPPRGRGDRLSALDEDKDWGLSSLRQIVLARLGGFIEAAEPFDMDPALRKAFSRLDESLRRAWGQPEEMALFPAFRN